MTVDRIPIQSRDQWLSLRTHDITASDVPAVCGEGLFGSPAKVWAEKRGLVTPAEMNEAMKRGIWGEAAVFEALAWEHPEWELRRAKVYLRDPAARLGATPDGVAIDPARPGIGIIQAKVISRPVFNRDWLDGTDDDEHGPVVAPLAYQLQTLTETMLAEEAKLADRVWAAIAVLVVDTFRWDLRIVPVDRHPGAEAMIRDKVAAFWRDYLDTGIQPPIDPTRDDKLVKALFPRDDGTEIDLSGDNELPELVETLETAKADIKFADDTKKTAETAIKAKLGEHSYGRMRDGRLISHKLQRRGSYQVKETEFRVLRIAKG